MKTAACDIQQCRRPMKYSLALPNKALPIRVCDLHLPELVAAHQTWIQHRFPRKRRQL